MITGKSPLTIKSGFTREDLRRISGDGDGWRLSLYMPLYRTGREVRQAPILLKDLRSRAAAELEARGCDPETVDSLLAPVNQIYEETDFTLLQGEGMAVLSSRGYSASFLMPIAPPAMTETGKRFLLDPLLPLLFEDGRFHLLALSLNSVRLYQADRLRLREVALEGLATNMREALRFEDSESYLMLHSGTPPAGKAGGTAIFHGHGGGKGDVKDRKRDILDFFQQIDKGIRGRLPEQELPLMLAGVEYLLPLYREANTHPGLVDGAVLGNPEVSLRQEDLHAKAWKIYREARERGKKGILRLYGERLASPEAVSGIRGALLAARERRILHLFLRRGYRQWGAFDPDQQRVALEDGPGPEREDLVNLACIHTLLGGGKVHVMDAGEIPERAEIAALCRY
ncbi:MAG TPA: hypothetical protein VJ385_06650 [Fibrobacteria bacterium]|nr:hypothetical protein [Fibrobacteria bacterium]